MDCPLGTNEPKDNTETHRYLYEAHVASRSYLKHSEIFLDCLAGKRGVADMTATSMPSRVLRTRGQKPAIRLQRPLQIVVDFRPVMGVCYTFQRSGRAWPDLNH